MLSAAKAAENVINTLDRRLSEELRAASYTDEIFSHRAMKAEFGRQQDMLAFLARPRSFSEGAEVHVQGTVINVLVDRPFITGKMGKRIR